MALNFYSTLTAGPKTKKQRYELVRLALWNDRQGGGFDSHWRDLSDLFFPRRSRFWTGDRNRGDKRNQNIIDSTGRYAARTLQSGLHAGLTSPARPWMKAATANPDLNDFPPAKKWLHEVSTRMLAVYALTNVYNALPSVYGDIGVFGTGAMGMFDDPDDLFRAYTYPLGSFAIGLDQRGLVNTFVREYEHTVFQLIERFGVRRGYKDIDWSVFSQPVKDAWQRGDYHVSVPVVHIIMPNEDYDPGNPRADRQKFASAHYERDDSDREERFLRESGFSLFPVMVPRWETTDNDAYGTDCPGMTALGDNKQLQTMQRRSGQLLQKAVDPSLVGPTSLRTQKTSLLAGEITYQDVRDGQQGLRPIHEVRLEGYQHVENKILNVQFSIKRAFYEDLFLMLAQSDPIRGSQPITAREVDERHEEKLIALGPTLDRTNDELLDPMFERTFQMMDAAGMIPDIPAELDGLEIKPQYTSILAQAQKLIGVQGLDRFMASVTPYLDDPEVKAKIVFSRVVNDYGEMLGVDPGIIRSDEEAAERVQAQAKMAAQMQAAEQAKTMATAMAQAGAKPVAVDSPLDRILRAQGAPTSPAPGVTPPPGVAPLAPAAA